MAPKDAVFSDIRPVSWPTLKSNLGALDTIAIAGAGSSATMYTGALRALQEGGLLEGENLKYCGNSSGAMIATLGAKKKS